MTVLIIILIIAVLIAIFWYLNKQPEQPAVQNEVQEQEETATSTKEEILKTWPEVLFAEEDYEGWKTFTHDELGYSIKYPADWIVYDQREYSRAKEVIINPPDAEAFTSYISIGIINGTLEGRRSILTNPDYYGGNPYSESEILFSNQKTYQFLRITTTARNRRLYIPHNNKLYDIDTQKDQNQQVQQALASFEFID